mmetsp:Transcript_49762/g.60166  ORF Transcript_49762/g.60166 Transcript_49762/m.60166 type:complete len:182 (-) Transcript_49762:377-922(-)
MQETRDDIETVQSFKVRLNACDGSRPVASFQQSRSQSALSDVSRHNSPASLSNAYGERHDGASSSSFAIDKAGVYKLVESLDNAIKDSISLDNAIKDSMEKTKPVISDRDFYESCDSLRTKILTIPRTAEGTITVPSGALPDTTSSDFISSIEATTKSSFHTDNSVSNHISVTSSQSTLKR